MAVLDIIKGIKNSDHELGAHRSARNYICKLGLFTNHSKYMKIYDERLQYLEFYQFNKKSLMARICNFGVTGIRKKIVVHGF